MCDAVAIVVSRQDGGITVTGFLGTTWLAASTARAGVSRRDIDRAIRAGDAAALHRMNPEFAAAWCPECGACYCRPHWVAVAAGADDHPGWYDATHGTCPEGHRRVLDD